MKNNKERFEKALKDAGIVQGDTILVHSNMFLIGLWEEEDPLKALKDSIFEAIGEEGTLVVPGYLYNYARNKEIFNLKTSAPSKELGVFSNYIFKQKNTYRSINPLTSLIALGKNAKYITGGNTGASYGYDTPWDRLLKKSAKMVFLGIDLRAMTFIHQAEHSMNVPHLYQKIFETPVYDGDVKINLPICSQVRYLKFNIEYRTNELTEMFEKEGLIKESQVQRGKIRVVDCNQALEFLCDGIKKDLYFLLKNKPTFNTNEIPFK